MIDAARRRSRRIIDAMGIGPVWVARAHRTEAVDDGTHEADHSGSRAARIAMLDWVAIQESVAGCVACRLCESRTHTVFGAGSSRPDWLIVGEAPGAEEDASGEPFVGQAGKLLDAMLASVGLDRTRNAFIANVLKCRPPDNRDPSTVEIASCRPYLERQIALLAPRMILVVGKTASNALLGVDATMGSLRGREHRVTIEGRAVPVVATYHPAYLLRSAGEKASAWSDLCLAREVYERVTASATA